LPHFGFGRCDGHHKIGDCIRVPGLAEGQSGLGLSERLVARRKPKSIFTIPLQCRHRAYLHHTC
jgi:hypothetical protein